MFLPAVFLLGGVREALGGTAQRTQRQERGNAVLRWGAGWLGEGPRRFRRGRGWRMRYYGGELADRGRDRAEGAEAGDGECVIEVVSWLVGGETAQRTQRQGMENALLRW